MADTISRIEHEAVADYLKSAAFEDALAVALSDGNQCASDRPRFDVAAISSKIRSAPR